MTWIFALKIPIPSSRRSTFILISAIMHCTEKNETFKLYLGLEWLNPSRHGVGFEHSRKRRHRLFVLKAYRCRWALSFTFISTICLCGRYVSDDRPIQAKGPAFIRAISKTAIKELRLGNIRPRPSYKKLYQYEERLEFCGHCYTWTKDEADENRHKDCWKLKIAENRWSGLMLKSCLK